MFSFKDISDESTSTHKHLEDSIIKKPKSRNAIAFLKSLQKMLVEKYNKKVNVTVKKDAPAID